MKENKFGFIKENDKFYGQQQEPMCFSGGCVVLCETSTERALVVI